MAWIAALRAEGLDADALATVTRRADGRPGIERARRRGWPASRRESGGAGPDCRYPHDEPVVGPGRAESALRRRRR